MCDQIARGDRKRSERAGNASNFFLYNKNYWRLFRVTSPFREFAVNFELLGDRCVTKLPAEAWQYATIRNSHSSMQLKV